MSRSSRRAFTLVELLLVVAICGALVGLVLSAVAQVRDAADRMQCQNNLKQVAIAAHNAGDTYGFVPANPDTVNGRPGTTQDHLQPFLE
jgi:type II secretory pathway pseudopilin PulG